MTGEDCESMIRRIVRDELDSRSAATTGRPECACAGLGGIDLCPAEAAAFLAAAKGDPPTPEG